MLPELRRIDCGNRGLGRRGPRFLLKVKCRLFPAETGVRGEIIGLKSYVPLPINNNEFIVPHIQEHRVNRPGQFQ